MEGVSGHSEHGKSNINMPRGVRSWNFQIISCTVEVHGRGHGKTVEERC